MPSLLRFISIIGVIAAIVYAIILTLALSVEPKPREMTVTVPPEKFLSRQK